MDSQNFLGCRLISPKTVLFFPGNFLDFRFDMIEKQSIISLSNDRIKSYTSVVLCDSEVTFLEEGKNAAFCPFFSCPFFIDSIAKLKKYVFKFSCLPYFRMYFVEACNFSAFNLCQYYVKFFLHKLPYFDVYLAINRFISDFREVS